MKKVRFRPVLWAWGFLVLLVGGASAVPLSLSGLELGVTDSRGLLSVLAVRVESSGALAGLRPGDEIVELDGENLLGRDPAAVEQALERTLQGGYSAVVVFVRQGASDVARLRPSRLRHHQRQLLEFRRAYLEIADESNALWEDVRRGMEETLLHSVPEESLERLLEETLWACRKLETRMGQLSSPALPDLRVGTFLNRAKDGGFRALRQREEALGVLADYVRRRRRGEPFEENLWLRTTSYAREVHHKMAQGERDLLEGLALVADTDASFDALLAREREEEARLRARSSASRTPEK